MPTCTAWGVINPRSKVQYPQCWTWDQEAPPTELIPKDGSHSVGGHPMTGEARMERLVPLHRWEAVRRDEARQYYVSLLRDGIPHSQNIAVAPSRVWRYRGAPYYLDQQMERMRITLAVTKKCYQNDELHRMSHLLGQLSERLIKMIVKGGEVSLTESEARSIEATLGQCEDYVAQLHLEAAAAAQAVDEARAAYKLPPKPRLFTVLCEFDVPVSKVPETNGESHKPKKKGGDHEGT